jgi:hypothetical protein
VSTYKSKIKRFFKFPLIQLHGTLCEYLQIRIKEKIVKATDQMYGTFGKTRSANLSGLSASSKSKVVDVHRTKCIALLKIPTRPALLRFLWVARDQNSSYIVLTHKDPDLYRTFFISRNGTYSMFSECLPFQKYLIFGNKISVLHFWLFLIL